MKRHQTAKRHRTARTLRRGFTLMEVLLVLAILGIIAAMVVPQLMGTQETAMRRVATTDMATLQSDLKRYTTDHDGSYPETLQELVQTEPLKNGTTPPPYSEKITDPWGNPYQYVMPSDSNQHFNSSNGMSFLPELYSWGPNGVDDGGQSPGDINNWDDRIREKMGSL